VEEARRLGMGRDAHAGSAAAAASGSLPSRLFTYSLSSQ
jgi:hypothetical protein